MIGDLVNLVKPTLEKQDKVVFITRERKDITNEENVLIEVLIKGSQTQSMGHYEVIVKKGGLIRGQRKQRL